MNVNGYEIELDADLAQANLEGANLQGANLLGAIKSDGSVHV
jgi:uncharacterized protein YjbI with pentapeptide repeats